MLPRALGPKLPLLRNYTGKAIKPVAYVCDNKTFAHLKEGTDYTLAYKDNVNAGTATVTVTGKGGYTGKLADTFKIYREGDGVWTKKTRQVRQAIVEEKFCCIYNDANNCLTLSEDETILYYPLVQVRYEGKTVNGTSIGGNIIDLTQAKTMKLPDFYISRGDYWGTPIADAYIYDFDVDKIISTDQVIANLSDDEKAKYREQMTPIVEVLKTFEDCCASYGVPKLYFLTGYKTVTEEYWDWA